MSSHFVLEGPVLRLSASVDFATLLKLQGELQRSIEALLNSGHRAVLLDLSSLTSCPSTALGLCMAAARRATESGQALTVRLKRKHAAAAALIGLPRFARLDLV